MVVEGVFDLTVVVASDWIGWASSSNISMVQLNWLNGWLDWMGRILQVNDRPALFTGPLQPQVGC